MASRRVRWRLWLRRMEPGWVLRRLRRLAEKWLRRWRRTDRQVVTLEPVGEQRGRVLFSYILDPFLAASEEAIPYWHTNYWESYTMAHAFAEAGYRVDCISWTNHTFVPSQAYDYLVDVRLNLQRLAPLVGEDTVKIFHIDTGHHEFHNGAQDRRLQRIRDERGARLRGRKRLEENLGIETADCATVLGNGFTQGTYAFARKPLFRIPISVPAQYPWPEDRDWQRARRRFLWFGSGGLVHKGLDLVLEAFAGMPELELVVCGPVGRERDFEEEFFEELYRTPNVHLEGWVDVAGGAFREILASCLAVVYPSCSEGGGGSVISCMHGGLIPVVTPEASVDVSPGFGVILRRPTVEEIRSEARALAARPVEELRTMARGAWEHAREHHTRPVFQREYRRFVQRLVRAEGKVPAELAEAGQE